jgi:hypothetical protein
MGIEQAEIKIKTMNIPIGKEPPGIACPFAMLSISSETWKIKIQTKHTPPNFKRNLSDLCMA